MISFVLVLSAIACLVLASLVIFQELRNFAHILFVGICLCFAAWAVTVLIFLQADTQAMGLFAAKGFYLAAGIFPTLLLSFALIFPKKEKENISYITLGLIGVLGLVMAGMIIFNPVFVIQGVITDGAINTAIIDVPTYLLYSAYFILLFAFAMYIAFKKFYRYKGNLRMQAGLYAFGILINSVPGFIANLYLPFFGIYDYIWVGPAASIFFLALTAYSIIRHGLFSIRLAAVRSTAYIFTLATLSIIYYILAYSTSVLLAGTGVDMAVSFGPVNIALALVLAFIFQPVKKFFDKVTNNVFFRDSYMIDDFLSKLTSVLSSTTDLRDLLRRAANEINYTLGAETTSFFVFLGQSHHLTSGTAHHPRLPIDDARFLRDHVDENLILASRLEERDPVRRLMVSHKLQLVMPLYKNDILVGLLCMGGHRTSGYTAKDIRALDTISDELVIAIENAISVHEVKELNNTLQQRIDSATKELRASNAQLQRLDEAKDEFVSMASHQLRTPLTSIKGYISMIVEGDAGKINPMQKKFLEEAFLSSERMVRLINDFLNVSRLQTGKFLIEKREADLAQIVQQELDSLGPSAAARGLKFSYSAPKKFPLIELDEGKIRQVIMNFSDNAIYYSKDNSTIKVSLKIENDQVVFKVKDTGIGVPVSEQAQLFNKFFRATNARKQRPDGTGVGLFLAKKVIVAHDGDAIFESAEGKGSTFGFRLPISRKN